MYDYEVKEVGTSMQVRLIFVSAEIRLIKVGSRPPDAITIFNIDLSVSIFFNIFDNCLIYYTEICTQIYMNNCIEI